MLEAYVFPGQGAQFPGMGKDLYENDEKAKEAFEQANEILGFRISDIMFHGTAEELKQTDVTQPAIFLHSVITFRSKAGLDPDMVAGHSLGEFSALVANGALKFEDALKLVHIRATAMQKACEIHPGTMAAILGLQDEVVEELCAGVRKDSGETVVAANYNCPGQLVISGSLKGIELACAKAQAAGAKRALVLPVGGAFHSPLMEPAKEELKRAIAEVDFHTPDAPVCQNVTAEPVKDPGIVKENLINQLTSPVRWTQSVRRMFDLGFRHFTECGPGTVLKGLITKVNRDREDRLELEIANIG